MAAMRSAGAGQPLLLCAVAMIAAGACKGEPTGVRIQVQFAGIAADQLEFTVFTGDHAATLIAPTIRPDPPPASPLTTPQSVVVILPDVAQTVICRARALSTPEVVGERSVPIRPNQVAVADIALDGKVNGDACLSAAECASGYCSGGHCCDKTCDGLCLTCAAPGGVGTCTAIPAGAPAPAGQCATTDPSACGLDGTCDGGGACRRYPAGVACGVARCAGSALTLSSTCDGAGACVNGPTIDCDPFQCDPTMNRCYRSCMSNGQCVATNVCSPAGSCGLKPLGASCQISAECNGDAVCADGVCCSTACGGACRLCNLAGREGFCSPVPAGIPDPKAQCSDAGGASCGTNGMCDGAGACQRYPAGTACPAGCGAAPGELLTGKTCDGNGSCAGGTSDICPKHFACNPADGTCFTACTSDVMCATTCNLNPATPRCRVN
jgi:hypothetical protein